MIFSTTKSLHQKRNPIKILFSKTFCNPALSVFTSVYQLCDSNKRQNSTLLLSDYVCMVIDLLLTRRIKTHNLQKVVLINLVYNNETYPTRASI